MPPQIKVIQASDAKAVKRKLRTPQHPFNIRSRPFEITPFCLAPVLPGDTMKNLLWQSRVISDPILNPIIGWHKEYHWFYVPLRSLQDPVIGTMVSGTIEPMFMDATYDLINTDEAGSNVVERYAFKGGFDWLSYILPTVVGEFFRDEDDVGNTTALDKYPAAYVDRRNWAQSLIDATELTGGTMDDPELPGVDTLEELDERGIGGEIATTTQYDAWEAMRDSGLTDLTFEDYLRSQGVSVPQKDDVDPDTGKPRIRPELLRTVRKWTYPTNHVDPTTGTPTSAVSYSIVERADKDRLFKEPGFILGTTVTRPKIYMGNQKGSATGYMTTFRQWPSVILKDHPQSSVVAIPNNATDGIFQGQTASLYFDMKDLFLYGEQFVNYAMSVAANHGIATPDDISGDIASARRLLTLTDVKSFFVDSAGTANYIREDGVAHLSILSKLGADTTPGGG